MLFAGGFFILVFMSKSRKNELIACLGLVFVTINWGLSFVFIKSSLDVMPPLYMLGIRFTIGGVLLAVIFMKRLKASDTRQMIHGTIIGVLLFVAEVFQTYGCKYTTAGKNAFLTTIYVILVPFLHFVINKVRPRMRYIAAAVICFWGIGLISLTEKLTIGIGDTLTLICGFFYAVQIIAIARFASDDDTIVLVIWQFIVTGVLSLASAPLASGAMTSAMFTRGSVTSLIFLIVCPTIFGYGLQTVCQKYAPPSPASIIMGMEAVIGAIASYFILGESMTGRMITGCVMLVLAMLMVEIDIIGYFYPDEYLDSAYSIDYERLYAEGKRGLIFDIDNTLVMHNAPPDERSVELLKRLNEMGFAILFLSNNKEERVKSFRDNSIPEAMYLYKVLKPKRAGYEKAMEMMKTDRDSTVFIGDQLFTDVWGAKRCGIFNILVKPIDPKEEIQIVLKRKLESIVLSSYRRSGANEKPLHDKKELNY